MHEIVEFKTTGYEIADIRNPTPPKTAVGMVVGRPQDGYIALWCDRENRESATIMVALSNILDKTK